MSPSPFRLRSAAARWLDRARRYRVASQWRLEATPAELRGILLHPERLEEWWPAAFLSSERVRAPDPDDAGGRYRVHTKGWAPYTMRFEAWVARADRREVRIGAAGDFEGSARLCCRAASGGAAGQGDPHTLASWVIDLEWRVRVNKRLLIVLSPLIKPLLVANHRWVVAQGEVGLRRALARWRAEARGEDAERLPAPPGPTWPHRRTAARRLPNRAASSEALS